ncbi:hypothetical protein D3C87_974440 [compost metagenome]
MTKFFRIDHVSVSASAIVISGRRAQAPCSGLPEVVEARLPYLYSMSKVAVPSARPGVILLAVW